MKNAYNTSAYGSFAYVYDIFMDIVFQLPMHMKRIVKMRLSSYWSFKIQVHVNSCFVICQLAG